MSVIPRDALRAKLLIERTLLVGAMLIIALAATSRIALGATNTDVFNGKATTGVGQLFPVDVNQDPSTWDFTSRAPAVGLPYVYRASGKAQGSLPGVFIYEERGYIYFTGILQGIPPSLETFAGGKFKSGEFNLDPNPNNAGDNVFINYLEGSLGLGGGVIDKKNALPATDQNVISKLQLKAGDPYATFTFAGPCAGQTHTGYASVDFREIAIEITWGC